MAGAVNTSGGGLYTNGYAEIYDSVFSNNAALRGGAIYFTYVTPFTNALEPLVERCTFTNNKNLTLQPLCCTGVCTVTNAMKEAAIF